MSTPRDEQRPARTRRVALVISSLAAGGAERVCVELANAWSERGWRVSVITLSSASSDYYLFAARVDRIQLDLMWESNSLLESIRSNLIRIKMLRRCIRDLHPEVLISFIDQTNVRVLAATANLPVKVIISERVDPRRYDIGLLWSAARRLLYPRASVLVVQTASIATWARAFLPDDKVRVIPNFVRALPAPGTARQPGLVLGVGRLAHQKGFDLLIHAFARCLLSNPHVRLVILGEGPCRGELESLGRELGVQGRLELPGVVQSPEDWMAQAELFVLPSRFEGFPNALLEAMAMGCAVIAADCGSGPRDMIHHGVDGLLVPPDAPEPLACALALLLGDPVLRKSLGRNAADVRERFAASKVIPLWEELV